MHYHAIWFGVRAEAMIGTQALKNSVIKMCLRGHCLEEFRQCPLRAWSLQPSVMLAGQNGEAKPF